MLRRFQKLVNGSLLATMLASRTLPLSSPAFIPTQGQFCVCWGEKETTHFLDLASHIECVI